MSVTEVKEALGQWNLRLRRNTPRELLDTVDKANYFGHIALIPGRGFNVAAVGDGLLQAARYVGVFRARFNQDDEYELKGVGMSMWLGNEDQGGDVFLNPVACASASFSVAIQTVLPPNGAITAGTLYNVGASGTYTGSFRWQTPREAITRICNVFTMDTADPVEYRVNGDGTLDAGKASQLYNTTNPTTMLVRRDPGRDLTLTGLQGSLSLDSDVEDYATDLLVFGEGDGASIVLGQAKGPATPYKDIHGNAVHMVKILNEPDASAASIQSVAEVAMSKVVASRSAAQLSTDEYDVKGTLKVGDALYVYDVENGFFDNTRQAVWQGQTINPILLRCTELTFPIPAGWTVAFRDRNGGWWDLSDYYAPESGSTSVVVGEFLQRLGGSGRDPLNGRPTPDSSVPDTPVFGPFFTASYLADSGQTRSQIQATWTRPLNTDRSVITDGDHYEVRWRPDAANAYAATWDELSLYPWPSGTGLSTLFGTDATVPTKVGNPVELNTYEAQVTSRALFSYLETELEAVVGTPLDDAITGLGVIDPSLVGARAADLGFVVANSGYWKELQPSASGSISTASAAWTDLTAAKATGLPVRWRIRGGIHAPDWVKNLDGGPITIIDPSDPSTPLTIPKWWSPVVQNAWVDFMTKIAALVDGDSQVREIAAAVRESIFTEPDIVQMSTVVASAGVNAGKTNIQVYYEAGLDAAVLSGGSPISPGANDITALEFPYALMPDGQSRWRAMGFKKTRLYRAFNPVQTYRVNSLTPFVGSLVTDPATWTEGTEIPTFVTRMGAQGIVANNSLRPPLVGAGTKYPLMYQTMNTSGNTVSFQTATQTNINTAAATVGIAAGHDALIATLDVGLGLVTTANDPLGLVSSPVTPKLQGRSIELPTAGLTLLSALECATYNGAASANFVRDGVATGAVMTLYHSRNGNDLPANWTASNASADASASLHSLADIKMRSKMDLLAAQDAATIATVAAFVGTIPSNGLTKYLVFEPEPELAVAAGTYTAATWREAAATFCKAVLDNRGTKPIHPVICLRGDTFDGTTARNPSDYNVVTSLLARGVSMSQVVFAQNAYSDAPGAAVGSVQAKLNQAFVSAQVWGFRRFGLNDVGVKTYDLDDRLAAPTWLQSLNAFVKNWHCEFVSWASSDQQSTAGLEGYYWTYSASAQLEIAQIAQDGATIGGSGGVSLLTWQQPVVPPIAGVDFTTQLVGWDVNNVVISELTPGQRYEFQIRAADNASPPNLSQWSASSFQRAALDTSGPSQPAAPLVASSRIAVQITHDLGLASGGAYNLDLDLDHLEIHAGGESFSPSPETLLGRSRANAAMLQARVPVVATYNVEATGPLFIRVVAVDKTGNKSAASPSASASALLIDDAHISDLTVTKVTAGTIAADWIVGAKVGTAPDGARAEMTPTGFAAYNADNVKTFSADNNGNVNIVGTLTSGPVNRRLMINPDGNDPTIRFYPDSGSDYALIAGYTADAEGNKPTSQDSWISMSSSLGSLFRRSKLVLSSDTVGTTFASRAWMSAGVSDAGTVRGGTLDLVDATDDAAKYAAMQVWGGAGTILSRLWASGGNLYFDGLTAYFDTFATSTMFRCGLFGFNGTTAHTFSYTNTLGTLPYPIYAIKASASVEHRLSAMSTTGFTVTTNVAVPANTDVIAWVAQ